jgi:hypothetical protein
MTVDALRGGNTGLPRSTVNALFVMSELVAVMTAQAVHLLDLLRVRKIVRLEALVTGNAIEVAVRRHSE